MRTGHKTYMGLATPHGVQARVRQGVSEEVLDLRLTLVKRSPEEWMDPDTGPQQLALAILADATGDESYAVLKRKKFSEEVTSALPLGEGWLITLRDVMDWVRSHPVTEDDL